MGMMRFSEPRPIEEGDCIDGFECGVELVDEWVRTRSKGARKVGTAVVYVSFTDNQLAGFYTLSAQSIAREGIGGWISRNAPAQVPVILLGMLGVDRRFQGDGLGRNLLLDASKRALMASDSIGARTLVVDPYGDAARDFYVSCGFRPIPNTDRMYAKLN